MTPRGAPDPSRLPSRHPDDNRPVPLRENPEWVLEMYDDAKDIIAAVYEIRGWLTAEIREDVEHFYAATFMDRCTTLGPDCGCTTNAAITPPENQEQS